LALVASNMNTAQQQSELRNEIVIQGNATTAPATTDAPAK